MSAIFNDIHNVKELVQWLSSNESSSPLNQGLADSWLENSSEIARLLSRNGGLNIYTFILWCLWDSSHGTGIALAGLDTGMF
jgi:hypothetical protein